MTSASTEIAEGLLGTDAERFDRLSEALCTYRALVVAFSGGTDSALLAYVATAVLGRDAVVCTTANSPSLAPEDLEETRTLAVEWGLRHTVVLTDELADPRYLANDLDRCFHCKTALMDVLVPIARAGDATVALGVNLDDLGEHRPGQRAAREAGAVFPLLDAGLSKEDVRSLSSALGLRTWDKPSNACLSSRIPQGTPVTLTRLDQVAKAESALRRLGFSQIRVRHHGEIARIELDPAELGRAVDERSLIVDAIRAVGYTHVTLDLGGFRSGGLVEVALERARDRSRASDF
ncbi:MAG TPA: ATP-dependent sacrificial sulfur transferase LarE [Acidimicrobiales bacterium]|nr:ATP-dependent sacrificial sulfur transferase LarE [Acidimicrobiales bacterium]